MNTPDPHRPARLLLWDIDGTLLRAGVGHRVASETLRRLLGREPEAGVVHNHGRTDLFLARERLRANGVANEDMVSMSRKYLRLFADVYTEMRDELAAEVTVCPGVRLLLTELSHTRACSTLLTGNVAPNAVLKLHTVNLQSFFDFEVGGYGADSENRSDLLPIALKRIEKKRKDLYDPHEIWVVGDTEHDHQVARDHGCRSMLVATGFRTYDELSDLSPDALFHDLSDTSEVMDTIFS